MLETSIESVKKILLDEASPVLLFDSLDHYCETTLWEKQDFSVFSKLYDRGKWQSYSDSSKTSIARWVLVGEIDDITVSFLHTVTSFLKENPPQPKPISASGVYEAIYRKWMGVDKAITHLVLLDTAYKEIYPFAQIFPKEEFVNLVLDAVEDVADIAFIFNILNNQNILTKQYFNEIKNNKPESFLAKIDGLLKKYRNNIAR